MADRDHHSHCGALCLSLRVKQQLSKVDVIGTPVGLFLFLRKHKTAVQAHQEHAMHRYGIIFEGQTRASPHSLNRRVCAFSVHSCCVLLGGLHCVSARSIRFVFAGSVGLLPSHAVRQHRRAAGAVPRLEIHGFVYALCININVSFTGFAILALLCLQLQTCKSRLVCTVFPTLS